MSRRLVLAIPSKGRLMEETLARFAAAGLAITRGGEPRGYAGAIAAMPEVDVAFLPASEIAFCLGSGRIDLGVTGEDLVREMVAQSEQRIEIAVPLGFGGADVVVAVPACWVDVTSVADIGRIAPAFRRLHGRHLRVATKYANLTRRFFASHGIGEYRIVESVGATEGTPAAGTAELIVDITSTGETLRANHLKTIAGGLVLRSQACLMAARPAMASGSLGTAGLALIRRIAEAT
jgi:ATP phosphoribosyltransferase